MASRDRGADAGVARRPDDDGADRGNEGAEPVMSSGCSIPSTKIPLGETEAQEGPIISPLPISNFRLDGTLSRVTARDVSVIRSRRCAPALENAMEQASVNQIYRLDQSPSAQAERLRKEARGTPPGVRRDQLLRRARQIESASRVQEWLASPNPRPMN
jgi:hypothetical protein